MISAMRIKGTLSSRKKTSPAPDGGQIKAIDAATAYTMRKVPMYPPTIALEAREAKGGVRHEGKEATSKIRPDTTKRTPERTKHTIQWKVDSNVTEIYPGENRADKSQKEIHPFINFSPWQGLLSG